jgi:hypothetical protein
MRRCTGLSPSARIGQRPVHDRAQRIGEVALADRAAERLGHEEARAVLAQVSSVSAMAPI